jgi:putative FmdB family regulatory protein
MLRMYDYHCDGCGAEFEALIDTADRNSAPCECGQSARLVVRRGPALSSKMGLDPDFPTAAARFRRKGEERGRGKDMTQANRTCGEDIQKDAWKVRKALGETPITVS